MKDCVIAVDLGTTRIKGAICDASGHFLARAMATAPGTINAAME